MSIVKVRKCDRCNKLIDSKPDSFGCILHAEFSRSWQDFDICVGCRTDFYVFLYQHANPPDLERCQDCGSWCDAEKLFLPEKYAMDNYSPDSFDLSELRPICDQCHKLRCEKLETWKLLKVPV